jgi:hypothetical protein|tara:strand:- start:896 stop:1000 length:105 start_codon:yes stop_codon:yes gene_type:complete
MEGLPAFFGLVGKPLEGVRERKEHVAGFGDSLAP